MDLSDALILARDLDGVGPGSMARRELSRVRRGAYAPTHVWHQAHPARRYRLLVEATVAAMHAPPVLSHESAAVILGLPIIGPWPERVHVVGEAAGGGRSSGVIVRHGFHRPPGSVVHGGVAVTSVARTVLDLARTRSFASALAAADYALAAGLCTELALREELRALRGARGSRRAAMVIERADGRAESVGESLSRARLYELHLAMPDLQRSFFDDHGFVGRTDFWWEELSLVGEFDGRVKYRSLTSRAGQDPSEIVWQEKRREDRLRRLGVDVLRWTWAEAYDRSAFAEIMRRAGVRAQHPASSPRSPRKTPPE